MGADREVLTIVYDGLIGARWITYKEIIKALGQNRRKPAKGYFVTYIHFLRDLQTLENFCPGTHICTKSV